MRREKRHTPGPIETLARMCIQSNCYREDADFRDAVDAVIGQPKYDAAPELLEALEDLLAITEGGADEPDECSWARAALTKAYGGQQ